MSVATGVGSERNLLDETPEHAHQLAMQTPILRNAELEKLRQVDSLGLHARTRSTSRGRSAEGPEGMARGAASAICAEADEALADGVNILILSDRAVGPERARDPVAAGGRGRPPPPRARGHAPAGRASCSSPASRARSTTSRR